MKNIGDYTLAELIKMGYIVTLQEDSTRGKSGGSGVHLHAGGSVMGTVTAHHHGYDMLSTADVVKCACGETYDRKKYSRYVLPSKPKPPKRPKGTVTPVKTAETKECSCELCLC